MPIERVEKHCEDLARLAAYEATGGKLWLPYLLSLLSDALAEAGRIQEGLAAIAKALSIAELNGDAYALPDLHRIKGELILKSAGLARVNDLQSDPGLLC